ncbi:uncharacterized protein KRP23_6272 [Phytophthora ramorum]|uniref:uncharacterized protein n=1 Tax=Phytophthora ramorum TaxID=164328 RepID=UPI0030A46E3B|nr:hypothetical protein KRP23_6272 [Phytophthora ramorum]
MQEDGAAAIMSGVHRAIELLARAAEGLTASHDSHQVSSTDIDALKQVLEELQRLILEVGSQRVLELSGAQLMNAGVELYNAPRAALRALEQVEKSKTKTDSEATSLPRYLLAVTRFVAAKVMELSLVCSKNGGGQENGARKNTQFMDECVDVLRSFGRVGMFLLESASVDCENCEAYLELANEAFSSSMKLWSRIGLAHLTKFKQGVELDDVVDDLWDFCTHHVRVLQLISQRPDNSAGEARDIVSLLNELKMLAPYKPSYASSLLDLMRSVSDEYSQTAQHELQVVFAEEALRVSESLENDADENFSELVTSFKQHVLLNLMQSLCANNDIERAEACYQLIPVNRNSKVLLPMIKLYVDNEHFDKAHRLLLSLFQQDNFDDSILGARTYAQGLSFSIKGMDIYRHLAINYGDCAHAINVEIACNLAVEESNRYRAMSELKRIGLELLEMERLGESGDNRLVQRVQQTIFDALQLALNSNQHEDCLKWADAGLASASSADDKATYMRTMSRSCLQLERYTEAGEWAEKAFAEEPSKQSLFTVFQVALQTKSSASNEELVHIMEQLKGRDDFEIEDFLAMGKLADDLSPARQDIVMHVLDEICRTMMQTEDCPANLPKEVILQNAAQLAFSTFAQRQTEPSPASSIISYGEKFLVYASALLQSSRPGSIGNLGPSSVFEWFYRMSFDIAKTTGDAKFFIVAANIAQRSDELYGEQSPLKQRCQLSLLATVSSDMKNIETLGKSQLLRLLEVIGRFESIACGDMYASADVKIYLAKSVIAVKLRLFDANTKAILDLCKATVHSATDLMQIGDLVLYATKFNEASEIRSSYRSLASEISSFGLQMLVQEDSIDANKLCYLLRRLITLAESKTKAYECFDQLIQFIDTLDVPLTEVDMEWFVVKAWNIGVSCHRSNDAEGALRFTRTAQTIMQHSESLVGRLGNNLDAQYQTMLRMSSLPKIGG